MSDSNPTLLVATPLMSSVIRGAGDVLDGIDVIDVAYETSVEERTRRERQHESAASGEDAAPATPEQTEAFAAADMALVFDAPLNLASIAPQLQWIQTIGSGVGHLAASVAGSNVVVTNAAGVAAGPIADWVVGRLLEVHKNFDVHRRLQAERRWTFALGSDIAGTTVLIVGLGAIGRAVARRLQAFDVNLIGIRRSYQPGMTDPDVDELVGPDQLHEAMSRSDAVVVAAASNDESDTMFDAAAFDAMRDGSIFINVARGHLVDEPVLISSLESGKLRAAAIDVARAEPLPEDDPLWDAPNLAISPHSSATGERYAERVFDLFVENLERFRAGQPLERVVDFG